MKRFALVALLAAMLFGVASVATATEMKVKGSFEVGAEWSANLADFDSNVSDKDNQYLVFLVRDDSFLAFRKARDVSTKAGYRSGWEYLGRDEPLTFVGTFARIKSQ